VAAAAAGAADAYGKVFFHHAEGFAADGPWVAGRVTPVVHYSMGGLAVDDGGRVLTEEGGVVAGLWAAGEVMGGLHGKNRLGGNALTEYVSRRPAAHHPSRCTPRAPSAWVPRAPLSGRPVATCSCRFESTRCIFLVRHHRESSYGGEHCTLYTVHAR
jgi:hypothetical protein